MSRDKRLQSAPSAIQEDARPTHRADQPSSLLSQKAVCERLGICDETWRRRVRTGLAPQPHPAFPLGSSRPMWTRQAIEAFERGELPRTPRQFFAGARRLKKAI